MRWMIWLFAFLLFTNPVLAQKQVSDKNSKIQLRAGIKGVFTGNLWSEPSNMPPIGDDLSLYWGDAQFYIGGGVGLFGELVFLRHLGLEVNLLYESNSLTFNQTFSGSGLSFEYDYDTQFQQLRIPILVKGVLPLGDVAEMSLGIGPEFVVGLSASVETDRRTNLGLPFLNEQADELLANMYGAEETGGIFFDVNLGLRFFIERIMIPIDLRAGINVDQPSDYEERVTIEGSVINPRATVKAIESYNFAILAGIGYVFI